MASASGNGTSQSGWVGSDGERVEGEVRSLHDASFVIDPASVDSDNRPGDGRGSSGNSTGGGRSRKPRSDRGSTRTRRDGSGTQKEKLDLGSFGQILFSTHAMLASITGNQMLMLAKEEADALAMCIGNVARHYDIPGVSQQTIDWIALIQTAGAIYGTRFVAARMSAKANAAKDVTPKPEVKEPPPPPGTEPANPMPKDINIPGFGQIRTAA